MHSERQVNTKGATPFKHTILEDTMSQCCACLSPQEERLNSKTVNRKGRERVYKILDRIQFTVPHVDVERAK